MLSCQMKSGQSFDVDLPRRAYFLHFRTDLFTAVEIFFMPSLLLITLNFHIEI